MTAALALGMLMAFTDPAGHEWCGRVAWIGAGHGGIPYAGLVVETRPPQWVQMVPVSELTTCKA